METTGVQQSSQAAATAASSRNNTFGDMKTEDFFGLLVSELQNQDPFKPTDTASMISQVSQLRDVEVSSQLTDTLTNLVNSQQGLGTADLIGKYVQGVTTNANGEPQEVAGVVTGVTFTGDGKTVLELDTGQSLLSGNVLRVAADQATAEQLALAEASDQQNNTAD